MSNTFRVSPTGPNHIRSGGPNGWRTSIPSAATSSLFGNQPVGWTVVRTFDNPASIASAGSGGGTTVPYIEGSPNPLTGGTTYRVTSGYGSEPPVGGPAMAESFLPSGSTTGGGEGRFGMDLDSLNADQIYIVFVTKMAADWPWSDNSNKAYQMNWGASLATEDRMLITFRSRQVGDGGYDAARDNLWSLGQMQRGFDSASAYYPASDIVVGSSAVLRDVWTVQEFLYQRNSGVGDGVFKHWVNGVICHDESTLNFPDGGTGIARRIYIEHVNNGIGGIIPNDGKRWVAYMHVAVP